MSEKEQNNISDYIVEKGYKPSNEGYKPSKDNITIDSGEIDPQGGYQPEKNTGNNPVNQPEAPGDE